MNISIIIPTYNRNKILCDTIEQLLNQDYKDFELLVVDQSEQHDEYTTKFIKELPENVKVIKVNSPNLPAARNIGIKHSTGDIIVFIDDDMGIPKDTLSKIISTFSANHMVALTGIMKGASTLAGYFQKKRINKKYEKEEILKVKHFLGGFMCFKKNIFEIVGGFDEWIGTQPTAAGEDLEFSIRMLRKGFDLYLDKRIEVEHIGMSIIKGGYNKSSFSFEENKIWQMRNNFYIHYKNRKHRNIFGSILAFWHVYRGSIFNSSLLDKNIKMIITDHKNLYRITKEIIPMAKTNSNQIKF